MRSLLEYVFVLQSGDLSGNKWKRGFFRNKGKMDGRTVTQESTHLLLL